MIAGSCTSTVGGPCYKEFLADIMFPNTGLFLHDRQLLNLASMAVEVAREGHDQKS